MDSQEAVTNNKPSPEKQETAVITTQTEPKIINVKVSENLPRESVALIKTAEISNIQPDTPSIAKLPQQPVQVAA